jgi:hypothetical protein
MEAFTPWQYYDNPLPPSFYQSSQTTGLINSLIQYDQQEQQRQGQSQKVRSPNGIRAIASPGQLMRFNYAFVKPGHDPQPLVMVAWDNWKEGYLNALNLHHITMIKATDLMRRHCDNGAIWHENYKGDKYIMGAYRTYKWNGVQNLKVEPCKFIVQLLDLAQQYRLNVGQISNLVLQIRKMAAEQVVPPAQASGEQPYQLAATPQPPQQNEAQ